jgi:hypothetical protein
MDICFCKSLKGMLSKGLLLLGEDSNHEGDKIYQKGATKIHTAMITPGETYILYTKFNLHKRHVQQLQSFFSSIPNCGLREMSLIFVVQ